MKPNWNRVVGEQCSLYMEKHFAIVNIPSNLREQRTIASEAIWEIWKSFHLAVLVMIHAGVLGIGFWEIFLILWILIISKIIFQFLPTDVSFKSNHIKLLCHFSLHLFTPHLYFSKSHSHYNISNCSTCASATKLLRAPLHNKKVIFLICETKHSGQVQGKHKSQTFLFNLCSGCIVDSVMIFVMTFYLYYCDG